MKKKEMTKQDLLPYCLYYKGEAELPKNFFNQDGSLSPKGLLWRAEKFVCEKISPRIDEHKVIEDITAWVGAFVGKWAPYEWADIMSNYRQSA